MPPPGDSRAARRTRSSPTRRGPSNRAPPPNHGGDLSRGTQRRDRIASGLGAARWWPRFPFPARVLKSAATGARSAIPDVDDSRESARTPILPLSVLMMCAIPRIELAS